MQFHVRVLLDNKQRRHDFHYARLFRIYKNMRDRFPHYPNEILIQLI